jgi:hypothetical protein
MPLSRRDPHTTRWWNLAEDTEKGNPSTHTKDPMTRFGGSVAAMS